MKSEPNPDAGSSSAEKGKAKKKKFAPRQVRRTSPTQTSQKNLPVSSASSPSIVKQEYEVDATKAVKINQGVQLGGAKERRESKGRGNNMDFISPERLPQYKHNPFLPMVRQFQEGGSTNDRNNRFSYWQQQQQQQGGLPGKQHNFPGGRGRGRRMMDNNQSQFGTVYFTGDIAKKENTGILSAKEKRLSEKLRKKEEVKKAKELEKERKRALKEEDRRAKQQLKDGGTSGQFSDADGDVKLNDKEIKLPKGKLGRSGYNIHDDKSSAFLYTGKMLGLRGSDTENSDSDDSESDSELDVSESSEEEFPLKDNDPLDPISLPFVPKKALHDLVDEGDILFEERKSQAEQEELILLQFPTHIPVERLFISDEKNLQEMSASLKNDNTDVSETPSSSSNERTILKVKTESEESGTRASSGGSNSTTQKTSTDTIKIDDTGELSGKDRFQGFDGIPSGKIGKIYVYKSGKCVFRGLGDSSPLVLIPGIPAAFKQEVVTVNRPDKSYSQLGNVTKKIVCCPDLESMLN